ncbi:MAG TPA: efflux RND transporter periplasmic adaptor subunit [Symbiobacteriaceae bacterium]|nr:efflux RND transporter periplasmic adaptor subunit [Symbiobacteriaceae bacterium]
MKRKWWIGLAFVAVVGLLVWANLQKATPASATEKGVPKNAAQVKVVKVEPRNLTQTVTAPGILEASSVREIRAPFTTTQVKLLVGAGDRVSAGQVMAELDSAELRVQVAQQEAGVARAEATLAQYRRQRESGPLALSVKVESSRAQLVAAEQGLESALKQADTARQRLEQARVSLLAVQNRASSGSADVEAARQALEAAEAKYRANSFSEQNRAALAAADEAYQAAVKRSTETARQASAELAQAHDSLQAAERDLAEAGEDSSAVRQARAQLESARLSLEAAIADAEAGVVSEEQIRSAETDLSAQRASLDNAREKLAQASLKSPVSGTVLTIGLKDGQPVQQGQLLFELGSIDILVLNAKVDEVDVGKVTVGQSISVRSNAHPTDKFAGKVTRVAAQSSQPDQRLGVSAGGSFYKVEGDVENQAGKLRAGMTAEARVVTDRRTGVIVIGLEAVREDEKGASVLVVREHRVVETPVKLGLRTQTEAEVLDGLKAGDEVIIAPFTLIKTLKHDTPVNAEVVPPPVRGDEE